MTHRRFHSTGSQQQLSSLWLLKENRSVVERMNKFAIEGRKKVFRSCGAARSEVMLHDSCRGRRHEGMNERALSFIGIHFPFLVIIVDLPPALGRTIFHLLFPPSSFISLEITNVTCAFLLSPPLKISTRFFIVSFQISG